MQRSVSKQTSWCLSNPLHRRCHSMWRPHKPKTWSMRIFINSPTDCRKLAGPTFARTRVRKSRPGYHTASLFLKLKRIQVRVTEHKPQFYRLPGQFAHVAATLPTDGLRKRVTKILGTIRQRKTRQRLAIRILNFNAKTSRSGCGIIHHQLFAR